MVMIPVERNHFNTCTITMKNDGKVKAYSFFLKYNSEFRNFMLWPPRTLCRRKERRDDSDEKSIQPTQGMKKNRVSPACVS